MNQRRIVYYSGEVQGVGFRFTARRAAAGYDITGYVRNLPDGRVEVVAEGPSDQIDQFLDDLAERMRPYIAGTVQQTAVPTGEFSTFDISK